MKKLLSAILTIVLIGTLYIQGFATSIANGEVQTYTLPNGETVEYYLDEYLNPYKLSNGQRIYLFLPLSHMEVKDEELLKKLNDAITPAVTRGVPSGTIYDLTAGTSLKSNVYTKFISYVNGNTIGTAILKLKASHSVMNVETDNIERFSGFSNKIIFNYFGYNTLTDRWYQLKYMEGSCTVISLKFEFVGSTYPYGMFYFFGGNGIKSFTVKIWTSMAG